MLEIWKDIKNYEGLYQISNKGRVKSLERIITYSNGRKHLLSEKILKNSFDNNGYLKVSLSKNKKNFSQRIHVLVLENFIGPRPYKFHVCHNNGIKSDNILSNLRWDSASNNMADKKKHGNNNIGEDNKNSKLKNDDIINIRKSFPKSSILELSSYYKVDKKTIINILEHDTWKHIGGKKHIVVKSHTKLTHEHIYDKIFI